MRARRKLRELENNGDIKEAKNGSTKTLLWLVAEGVLENTGWLKYLVATLAIAIPIIFTLLIIILCQVSGG
jgi:hypothetical protein